MKRSLGVLMTGLVAGGAVAPAAQPGDGVTAEPIAPQSLHGHPDAIVLRNPLLEVAIFPALGRIGVLRFGDLDNVLRFDTDLARQASTDAATDDHWRNFGGDWLWPVSQAHWEQYFHRSWPPRLAIDGRPWEARAWVDEEGLQTCLLRIDIGAPLYISVQRKIQLGADSAVVTISQRIERNSSTPVPVTLWNISQIPGARLVALPVDDVSRFPGGYSVLAFAPPAADHLTRAGGVLVMDVQAGGEHKIGSDSPRGWIAAQRESVLLVERAVSANGTGEFPDGGCRVELYANSGLGYTEIETLSEERALDLGEAVENTLTLSLHTVAPDIPPADLASLLRELTEEPAAPPVPALR